MARIALLDASVLGPAPLRDFLLRLAHAGVVRVRWSNGILDECFRSLVAGRLDLSAAALTPTRQALNAAFPSALVERYEELLPTIQLRDDAECGVLAAAIHASAAVIVTFRIERFPPSIVARYGVDAIHPDDFVLEQIADGISPVRAALVGQARGLRGPPMTPLEVLSRLEVCGLPRSVARLRGALGEG